MHYPSPKVIVVLPYYLPFPGGAEKSTHERLRRLTRIGFSVEVLIAPTPHRPLLGLPSPDTLDGVCITKSSTQRDFLTTLKERVHEADILFYSRANLLRTFYAHEIDGILLPLRDKVVYFIHDLDSNDYFDAAVVVANSCTTMWQVPSTAASRRLVLKPLIAIETCGETTERRFVTMINPRLSKGGELFSQLARSLPTTSFLAQLGCGEPVRSLKNLSNVEIREPAADIADVYAQTTVLLVPSPNEAFGRVAIEGALYGCLVCVHRKAGLSEMPLPEYSFIDDLHIDRWKERLLMLLNTSRDEREILREQTVRLANSYDPGWDQFMLMLREVLDKVRQRGKRLEIPS